MDFTIMFTDIFSRPLRRAVARFLDTCTVVLTTGRQVYLEEYGCFSYEGAPLSDAESKEVVIALSALR